jgi:hypothetical protein
MRITVIPLALFLLLAKDEVAAFAPLLPSLPRSSTASDHKIVVTIGRRPLRMGYLDDLSRELYKEVDEPDLEKTYEATKARKEETDRYGVGDWKDFVDFEEFDGGDGQMGVAGDGKKGLEKVRSEEAKVFDISAGNLLTNKNTFWPVSVPAKRSGREQHSWPSPRR